MPVDVVRGFKVIAITPVGVAALPNLKRANLPSVLASDNIVFLLKGRMKLFVKEGDVKRVVGLMMKLYSAYEEVDYKLEVF
jgi:hypothetical protein